jgi:hypothetical protein
MKRLVFACLIVVTLLGTAALVAPANKDAAAIASGSIPPGYRDWRLISVAHEAGDLNDLRAILGNAAAVNAARTGKLPFPDGAIIARLAWRYTPSEDNNRAFGRAQSFVTGAPVNGIQFMVKDTQNYAATGGWGFAQFNDGKPAGEPARCFTCHTPAQPHDFVFTRYSP